MIRMNKQFSDIPKLLGIESATVSHAERIASAVGGFIAILCVFVVSQWFVGTTATGIIIASMGASAVLLFAVPHGQLSQPWAVFGGHLISAVIGVTCAKLMPNNILAASIAVGISIGAMYYLNCIHPPGGATALSAVIGGEAVHALGYQFVFTPILINVLIILTVAILYNYLFHWRRYPIYLHKQAQQRQEVDASSKEHYSAISHADFVYALSELDSFVDISEYELLRIYDLATKQANNRQFDLSKIALGNYYSNGEFGEGWSVRHIVDEYPNDDPEKYMLIYKVIAGKKRRTSSTCSLKEFSQWAEHEVIRVEGDWKKTL